MALVDAALKKKIRKFVLMSSLLTNGKEAGQSLNPGTDPPAPPPSSSILFNLGDHSCCATLLRVFCCQKDVTPEHALLQAISS